MKSPHPSVAAKVGVLKQGGIPRRVPALRLHATVREASRRGGKGEGKDAVQEQTDSISINRFRSLRQDDSI